MFFGRVPDDSGYRPMGRQRRLKIFGAAAVLLMLIGLSFGLVAFIPNNTWATFMLVGVVLLAVVSLSAIILSNARPERDVEKRKRGLGGQGQDMYSLIDRMVDDLDEDELDYLRQRLEQRESGSKNELAESLDDLLVQREEDRKAERR